MLLKCNSTPIIQTRRFFVALYCISQLKVNMKCIEVSNNENKDLPNHHNYNHHHHNHYRHHNYHLYCHHQSLSSPITIITNHYHHRNYYGFYHCSHGLFALLKCIGCPPKLLAVIEAFNLSAFGTVQQEGQQSKPFEIKSGVK